MTSLRESVLRKAGVAMTGAAVLAIASLPAGLSGCKEKKKPAPPPPVQVAPPPPPDPVDANALLQQMQADSRVQFPQEYAPVSEGLARGVISLADALVRNDDAALRSMLDDAGRGVMSTLSITGDWDAAVSQIQTVRIVYLTPLDSEESAPYGEVTFAIQEPGEAYLLRWSASPGPNGEYVFGPLESAGTVRARASDFDGESGVVVLTSLPPAPGAGEGGGRAPDAPAPEGEAPAPTGPRTVPSPGGPIPVPGSPGGAR